jgi:hypothetical protein
LIIFTIDNQSLAHNSPMKSLIVSKTIFFSIILSFNTKAQTQLSCDERKLVGQWKEIASMPGIVTNLDSAKDIAINTKRNIGTWEFFPDQRYQYKHALHRSRYKPKGSFMFDRQTCEIIIASRKHKRDDSNLEIIHLDDRYLLYKSNNNPKGYFTHLLRRAE